MRVQFIVTCDTHDGTVTAGVIADGNLVYEVPAVDAITALRGMAATCERIIDRMHPPPKVSE